MDQIFFIEAAAAFLLGAVIGSFVNVLVFRYGTGADIVNGRSRCMRCGHRLGVLDLVPVFSYLFLGGRCRYCKTRISPQYPLVELSAAALSLGAFLTHPELAAYLVALALFMALLFAVVYDLRHLSLPLPALWVVGGAGLAAAALSCTGGVCSAAPPTPGALMAGPFIAAPLFAFSAISGGRWMGWGDGFLALGLSWFLGPTGGVTALCFAFWIGAVVGLALIGLSHLPARRGVHSPVRAGEPRFTMISELPFAPFLMLGVLIVYFARIDLFITLIQ